jgi:hypothetical protein
MDDISRAKTTYKGVVTANGVGLFSSDKGEKHKTFDQQQQKSDLALHRLATNDISRAKTTYKGVVTANDVGFCSDQGEKRKTFDQ